MFSIAREVPAEDSLLRTCRGPIHPERWGKYGDCFSVSIEGAVSLAQFVAAFYTSPLFRIERLILGVLAAAPSKDSEAHALAVGSGTAFAIWYMGARTATQLLMCDRFERTRSWFRVVTLNGDRTLLQFGSALAAIPGRPSSEAPNGKFRVLLAFHVWYSQALLHSANRRLMRNRRRGGR
jgi:hypothetical protein